MMGTDGRNIKQLCCAKAFMGKYRSFFQNLFLMSCSVERGYTFIECYNKNTACFLICITSISTKLSELLKIEKVNASTI